MKKPLQGVTFQMKGVQTGEIYTGITDEEGKIAWNNLVAQKYTITEIKTREGYQLLQEEIEVTLPVEMSLEELKKNNIDFSQAIYDEQTKMYGFYDLTYHIDNTATFSMPLTGGTGKILYIVVMIGIVVAGTGTGVLLYRSHSEKNSRKL